MISPKLEHTKTVQGPTYNVIKACGNDQCSF